MNKDFYDRFRKFPFAREFDKPLSDEAIKKLFDYTAHLLKLHGLPKNACFLLSCVFADATIIDIPTWINKFFKENVSKLSGRSVESIRRDIKLLVKSGLLISKNPEKQQHSFNNHKVRSAMYKLSPDIWLDGDLNNIKNISTPFDVDTGTYTVVIEKYVNYEEPKPYVYCPEYNDDIDIIKL